MKRRMMILPPWYFPTVFALMGFNWNLSMASAHPKLNFPISKWTTCMVNHKNVCSCMESIQDIVSFTHLLKKTSTSREMIALPPGTEHSSNSTNGWHGRYMRFSNNEWLSLSGQHGRSCNRKRWLKDSGMEEILTRIPPAKTSHPDRFIQRTIYVFQHLDDITEHFADDYSLHRFLDYCGDKKMCAEVVNHFVHGGNKYKHQKEDYDSRKLPVTAYGGALSAQPVEGKSPLAPEKCTKHSK
ncbi:hypothetical protein DM01DRAFT_1176144 [Hesseltinella vesiculosa]|uniref:Uncharacterized protein n=1 Tax=Hesseltinella vesiculosa TaxID=101127 RepID=A0A1X2G4X4_9FUNG|nr:hypothetical protein DM01DRAFT_1176144 [Hesseltinella vesiculosa]